MSGSIPARSRIIATAPGILVFLALWMSTVLPFDYRRATTRDIDFLWQSLGIEFLSDDAWSSLSVLHIQPPGLNALFALDLALTPESHLVLLGINVLAAVATIALLVDGLLRASQSIVTATAAGILYALLPGTVLYSLYAYNTTLTAFFAILAIWPLTWLQSRPAIGTAVSALGAMGLVLTRSSFIWPAMLVWCVALIWWAWRTTGSRWRTFLAAAAPLAAVIVLQLHYLVSFQLPFMSSWSGQNLAKGLQVSNHLTITNGARDALTPCERGILTAWQAGELNIWDPGGTLRQPGCQDIPPAAPRGIPAWDEPLKPGSTEMNFNEGRALVASAQWTGMMGTIIRADPFQLVRMAVISEDGFTRSGLGLYLRPSDDYPFLDPARAHLVTASIAAPLAGLFAPVLWLLVVAGWITATARRSSALRDSAVFWFASGLLVFHAGVSTLLEYSENMRYRAEIDPVLLFAGALALVSLMAPRRTP
jgi:hypothetical protein